MNPMSTAHESSDTVVRNLSKRYEIYNTPRDRLKQLVLPHLYQAAKRFEFAYEMAWKALKRVLDYLGIDARAPRPMFKEAYLIPLLFAHCLQPGSICNQPYSIALVGTPKK